MHDKLLQEDFKERVNRFYKSLDCKYLVFKIEDLLEAISEGDYLNLINITDKYNKYRDEQEKSENKYFVVNREEFPRFKKAEEFFTWLKNKNKN